MRASQEGRDELSERVQRTLYLGAKKEAEHVVSVVIRSLETILLNHLGVDGFTESSFAWWTEFWRRSRTMSIAISTSGMLSTNCTSSAAIASTHSWPISLPRFQGLILQPSRYGLVVHWPTSNGVFNRIFLFNPYEAQKVLQVYPPAWRNAFRAQVSHKNSTP